jgi:hypothetical protein
VANCSKTTYRLGSVADRLALQAYNVVAPLEEERPDDPVAAK